MEETLKMGTLGSGCAALSGWQWLKKIISSPWTHYFFCSFFPPPFSDSHSPLIRYPPWVLLGTACKFYREKRLCKQRGRLKLTGLAEKSQTLSYRLSGECVCVCPFSFRIGQACKPQASNCELSHLELRVCRTVRKDTLCLNSHLIYYIWGG